MQSFLIGLAVAVSLVAGLASGYALTQVLNQEGSDPSALESRLEAMDTRLARIERALEAIEEPVADLPSLVGRPRVVDAAAAGAAAGGRVADAGAGERIDALAAGGAAAEGVEQIEALVDEAVEKKAAQFQHMQDKKPPIDLFAKTLELTEEQRRVVEQEVLRGQHEIKSILETPAADGTIFLDDLVEIMADSIARPGENPGRIMKLFGRLMSETIPGTDDTFAARTEAVKGTVRDSFRRELSEKQYAVFEAWKMDPTEIKGIEFSPWKELEGRVFERAKELGAELPDRQD